MIQRCVWCSKGPPIVAQRQPDPAVKNVIDIHVHHTMCNKRAYNPMHTEGQLRGWGDSWLLGMDLAVQA